MASFRGEADKRFDKLLKAIEGEPPKRKSLADEQETPNPLPDKDYTSKQQPFGDDEENDPEIDGR